MALQLPCEKTLTRTGYAQGSITHRIPTGRLQVPVQGVPRTGMIQGFHRYQSAHLCKGGKNVRGTPELRATIGLVPKTGFAPRHVRMCVFFTVINRTSTILDAAAAEIGRNPVSKHQPEPEYGDEQADAVRDCQTRLVRPNSQGRAGTGKYSSSLFS